MAHTLIFEGGMPPQPYLTSCKVNGVQVSSGYTLQDGDVIEAYYRSSVPPRQGKAVYVVCNGDYYSHPPVPIEIELSDVDIVFSGNGITGTFPSISFTEVTLIINYSESGGVAPCLM